MIQTDILVIGAGLAGLTLARDLSGHRGKVVILVKSKSAARTYPDYSDASSVFGHASQSWQGSRDH